MQRDGPFLPFLMARRSEFIIGSHSIEDRTTPHQKMARRSEFIIGSHSIEDRTTLHQKVWKDFLGFNRLYGCRVVNSRFSFLPSAWFLESGSTYVLKKEWVQRKSTMKVFAEEQWG